MEVVDVALQNLHLHLIIFPGEMEFFHPAAVLGQRNIRRESLLGLSSSHLWRLDLGSGVWLEQSRALGMVEEK
jgi:hypothetical protein